jgi:hypothetical protein
MDTDSAYMGLSGDFFDIIKPETRSEFFNNLHQWLPRLSCDTHRSEFLNTMIHGNRKWEMQDCCEKVNKFDQRTPGLFKEEFVGDGIISLNSKTYFCWVDKPNIEDSKKTKYRSKGLSRNQNKLTKEQYLSVLYTKIPVSGENIGFCKIDNNVLTYALQRNGLLYDYLKRIVLADGVSTKPLDK